LHYRLTLGYDGLRFQGIHGHLAVGSVCIFRLCLFCRRT
jgi:hypothetical protein